MSATDTRTMADQSEQEDEEKTVPDGGWGWMVALGCFIIVVTLPGMTLSFSILFSTFLLELGVSSTTTAWIFNSHLLLWNLVGPLLGPLTSEFGHRKLSMFCTCVSSVCLILCSFANSAEYLLVIFALGGLFGGLGCKPCYLMIAVYFKRRRGMATAIMMAGMCTGQFVGPPLIRLLQEQYGFRGATLIIGGIMLNSVVGASLFRPLHRNTKASECSEKPAVRERKTSSQNDSATKPEVSFHMNVREINPLILRNKRIRQVSESSASLHLSTVDLAGYPTIYDDESGDSDPKASADESKKEGFGVLILRVLRSTISDLAILASPPALIIALGGLLSQNGYLNFTLMMPFSVQARGYSLQDAAWCQSVAGVCNLIARLSTSALSDCSWFNMQLVYVLGAVVFGTATLAFTFVTDLLWMKVFAGVWGVGVGINISLYTLVMARVMGVEKLAALLGASSLLVAMGYISLGPLMGFVRDVSGSYDVTMYALAGEVFLSVLLWCFMPTAVRCESRRRQRKEDADV